MYVVYLRNMKYILGDKCSRLLAIHFKHYINFKQKKHGAKNASNASMQRECMRKRLLQKGKKNPQVETTPIQSTVEIAIHCTFTATLAEFSTERINKGTSFLLPTFLFLLLSSFIWQRKMPPVLLHY